MAVAQQKITFDIFFQQPTWVANHGEKYKTNIYRIFINNELMTERNWIWGEDRYLREHIWAELESSYPYHELRFVPVLKNQAQAQFTLKNLRINGWPRPIHDYETTFRIE
jgi:hypothetical protein